MACGDDLPDITDLPADAHLLRQLLDAENRRLRELKDAERRKRQEKFRARKQQRLARCQQQPQHEREHQESSADQATAGPPTQPAVRGEEPTATTAMHAEQIRGADAEMARLQAQVQSLELEFEGLQLAAARQRPADRPADGAAGGADAEARSEAGESFTSEERRMEDEIRELEVLLSEHGQGLAAGSKLACPAPSCSLPAEMGEGKSRSTATSCAASSPVEAGTTSSARAAAAKGGDAAGDGHEELSVNSLGHAAKQMGAPPCKGKGGGKGKTCAPKGPPPKNSQNSPRVLTPKASAAVQRSNGLVNLHWKVSHEPEDLTAIDRSFLQRLRGSHPLGTDSEEECGAAAGQSDVRVPMRPATIFCPRGCAPDPPRELLDDFFGRRRSSWKPPGDGPEPPRGLRDRRKSMLDKKRLYMLGILVQKHLMENRGENNLEAVSSIKRAVLRCDYTVVRLEGLGVLRTVLQQHEKDGRPVCAFVRSYGDDALDGLDNPEHHRLVHELSKVPQIDERLECMLFHMTFRESFSACVANLEALRKALAMLDAKRDTIRCFFITAHRLGQSLNRESKAPQAPQGFQLSTLAKLSQTKSTKLPKLSILHFVLALMCRDDAGSLFDEEDFALLQNVKALRTHKVFCDCVELAQGIYGVQQICETGNYTCQSTGQAVKIEKRRKSVPPSSTEREPAIDTDDNFHEVMKEFVDANLEAAEDIAEDAMNAVLKYKELALYFDDLRSVYPPPKNENDVKKDLCDIFYRFAEDIRHHREEVESESLREILAASGAAGEGAAAPASPCAGPSPSGPPSHWPGEPCLYAPGQQRDAPGMDGGGHAPAARGS